MTTDTAADETATRSMAIYGLEEVESLPPKIGRTSKLTELLDIVMTKPNMWLSIAKYENSGAASAAASTLRAKYGPVKAGGFSFAVRMIEGGARHALFVRYEPELVDPKETSAYAVIREEREEKKAIKEAAKADAKRKKAAAAAKKESK